MITNPECLYLHGFDFIYIPTQNKRKKVITDLTILRTRQAEKDAPTRFLRQFSALDHISI